MVRTANPSAVGFVISGNGVCGSKIGRGPPLSVAAIHSPTQAEMRSTRVRTLGTLVLQKAPPVLITPSSTAVPSPRRPIAGPPLSPKQPPLLFVGVSSVHICCVGE